MLTRGKYGWLARLANDHETACSHGKQPCSASKPPVRYANRQVCRPGHQTSRSVSEQSGSATNLLFVWQKAMFCKQPCSAPVRTNYVIHGAHAPQGNVGTRTHARRSGRAAARARRPFPIAARVLMGRRASHHACAMCVL